MINFYFLKELQEINEEGEPTVTKEQNSEEDEDQAWIPINLFFITFDHIYVTNIITVIKTQESQMINTDEETSNENLQKKVNHCVGNFEKAFKIIKKNSYLFVS